VLSITGHLRAGYWVYANYGPIFRRLWTKVHQIMSKRGRGRSLQRRFPIVDILFLSGDIRDRSAKSSEIAPKKSMFFGPKFLWGGPQILDLVFKIAPISDHVAKFRGDRPRDPGDLALKKKRAAKHKGRGCVIATGGPN